MVGVVSTANSYLVGVAMVMAAKASTKIARGEILLIPTKERQPGPKIAKQLPHPRRIQ